MKMMKRLWALFLSALMLLSLCACGASSEGTQGQEAPAEREEARSWYEKSGAAGNGDAYLWLGDTYYFTSGDWQDYGKAFETFTRAVELWKTAGRYDSFFPMTVRIIGDMYAAGQGVEKSTEKANEYYAWAADLESGG